MPSFTYYRQFEEMDCGAACLRMVAMAHGREFSLEELRERTRISRQGVSLLGISEGAESIGLQTLALPITLKHLLSDLPLPCILPWRGDHFVVLYGAEGEDLLVADPDPDVRKVAVSVADFERQWATGVDSDGVASGLALVLEPTPEFRKPDTVPDRYAGSMTYLRGYLYNFRGLLAQVGLGMLLAVALQVAVPFLLKALVDYGIVLKDPNLIVLVVTAQAIVIGASVALSALRRYLLSYVSGRVHLHLSGDYLAKLMRLPLSFFDSRSRSDLLQRVADHDTLQETATRETTDAAVGIVSFLAFSIVLLWWSLPIFLVLVIGLCLVLLTIALYQRRRTFLDRRYRDQRTTDGEQLVELIDGIADLKQYNAELDKRWAWERQRAEYHRSQLALGALDRRQDTTVALLNHATSLSISLLAALAVLAGTLSIGALVAIHFILAQLNGPLQLIGELFRKRRAALDSLERIGEVHAKVDEQGAGSARGTKLLTPADISIEGLGFHYNHPQAPTVIRSLTMSIPTGETTAIVGPSGSGKSTLLKLLVGLYTPTEGSLLIGGKPLQEYELKSWRSQVKLVSHDGYLFTDTLLRNLTLGDYEINRVRLDKAIQITQLGSVIAGLPQGIDTVIGAGGMGLSRGQRQRILLARAVYHKPAYLLLDEATSGLDAFMELTIMDELFAYFREATVVVVAHRYATFQQADRIILLENGTVAESGSHERLMDDKKQYYRLVRHQTLLGN